MERDAHDLLDHDRAFGSGADVFYGVSILDDLRNSAKYLNAAISEVNLLIAFGVSLFDGVGHMILLQVTLVDKIERLDKVHEDKRRQELQDFNQINSALTVVKRELERKPPFGSGKGD
ncbi:hypothetical protein HOY82DRAFT_609490 [Tuber indicum]|nr:hypothetical protein HOY82DRAFT_609490 [Tuber indicum]